MKSLTIFLSFIFIFSLTGCSEDDVNISELKSRTDCTLSAAPGTDALALCTNSSETALPNDNFKVVAKCNQPNSAAEWTIEEGSIEIVSIKTNTEDGFTKSIATLKFNSDFSGGGIRCKMNNNLGTVASTINIGLEQLD